MSVEAITWAYQQDVVPGAKFVLVTLANYADETGYCYPRQATLAKKTGRSERSVRSHLARLEELGLLERSERRNKKGARTSDAFDLKWDADKRKELPVGEVPTGKSRRTNRQILPVILMMNGQRNLKVNQMRARARRLTRGASRRTRIGRPASRLSKSRSAKRTSTAGSIQ